LIGSKDIIGDDKMEDYFYDDQVLCPRCQRPMEWTRTDVVKYGNHLVTFYCREDCDIIEVKVLKEPSR